jgi:hypothetical protein
MEYVLGGIFLVTNGKELSQTVARILEYLMNKWKGKYKVKGEKKEQRKRYISLLRSLRK